MVGGHMQRMHWKQRRSVASKERWGLGANTTRPSQQSIGISGQGRENPKPESKNVTDSQEDERGHYSGA
jgi:hypothetical protein